MPSGKAIEVEGGYKWDYIAGRDSEGWYRLQYRGEAVAARGEPTAFSDPVLRAVPKIDSAIADRAALALRLEEGTLALAGGLLDMEGVQPIALAGLEKLRLRGTGFVATDNQFKQVNVAIGVETPSLHLNALGRQDIANWLIVGVHGQRRELTDSAGGDSSFAAVTYRAYVGKAFYREQGVQSHKR
jgi:hypothetical protein